MLRLARNRLETSRLVLRKPQVHDAGIIAALANTPEITSHLEGMPHLYGEASIHELIARAGQLPATRAAAFVICLKGENPTIIGFCGYGPSAEGKDTDLGCWIGADHWKNGYAHEACRAVLTHAFCLTMADAVTIDSRSDNPAGLKLLEKLGFSVMAERTRYYERLGREVATLQAVLGYEDWLCKQAA